MEISSQIEELKRGREIIPAMVAGVSQEQAAWRPAPDRWTILEVVNHLVDIEVEDFRFAMELVLYHPEDSWAQFDIETWRVERAYNQQELSRLVARFSEERAASISWLETLDNPDMDALHSGKGFSWKPMRAGDVLVSWIAHDLFHIRQLALLRRELLEHYSQPYSGRYSGFALPEE